MNVHNIKFVTCLDVTTTTSPCANVPISSPHYLPWQFIISVQILFIFSNNKKLRDVLYDIKSIAIILYLGSGENTLIN